MFPFKTALNGSTLFPFALDVKQQVRIAAEAGFEGIELWVADIAAFLEKGGTITDLRTYSADTGVQIVNAIAFFKWADADESIRELAFAQAEREMRLLADLGCRAVAAPPYGDVEGMALDAMAGHFARLMDGGRRIGVEPYLEFWGRAAKLSSLSEAVFIAIESGRPDVKILVDPFHMYTGGSDLNGLAYVKGSNIGIVHVNDYPAAPGRKQVADRDRVFPGEGVAPTHELARLLDRTGYHGFLSLEVFCEDYGGEQALEVAKRGRNAIVNAYQVAP